MSEPIDRGMVFRLFEQALALEEPERGRYMLDNCHGDERLHAEIESLLAIAAADGNSTAALSGAPATTTRGSAESLLGHTFGRFRLVEFIAAGGMGVVYRAERTDGLQQTVAVKLLANELGALAAERFRRETQLLARLEHPNIAHLIDAGVEGGRAWFALEFVRGRPIDGFCDTQKLPLRARVRLLTQLAGAVGAAHRMLVVHRDIKPANVLVTAEGLPKLIDFGIATVLQGSGGTHQPTVDIGRLFTPQYSAPEQVMGEPVTVATDVFGLGALAYRLLSGQVPYPDAHGAIGYLHAITHSDIAPASVAAGNAGADPALVRQLRGDLDAILARALERDPAQRYASAADLQADLKNYLDDVPVVARRPSTVARVGKFVRRHRLAVGLSALLATSVVGGAIAYGLQEHKAALAGEVARRRGEFVENMLKSADPRGGRRDITVADVLDSAAGTLDQKLGNEPLVEASLYGLIAATNSGLGRYVEGLAANDRQLALLKANGASATDVARVLAARGEILFGLGRFEESKVVYRQALPVLGAHGGPLYDYAGALNGLGKALNATNGNAEAERLLRQSIAIYQRGDDSQQALARYPMENLVMVLRLQGKYPEAVTVARAALALQRHYLPADHPDVLTAQTNYASALELTGQYEQAHREFVAVVAASTRVLGPEHLDTVLRQEELARNLFELREFTKGRDLLRASAETLDRVAGPGHAYSLQAWIELGLNACHTDDPSAGLAAIEHVARVIDRNPDDNGFDKDWHVYLTRSIIGQCLVALHRYREAEPILLKSIASLEASRGQQFVGTQNAYSALHQLYLATGRPQDGRAVAAKMH